MTLRGRIPGTNDWIEIELLLPLNLSFLIVFFLQLAHIIFFGKGHWLLSKVILIWYEMMHFIGGIFPFF